MPEEGCDGIAMTKRLELTKEIKNTSKVSGFCVQLSCDCVNENVLAVIACDLDLHLWRASSALQWVTNTYSSVFEHVKRLISVPCTFFIFYLIKSS